MFARVGIIVACTVLGASSVSFRGPVIKTTAPAEDVEALRAKLTKIEQALVQQLSPNGPLAHSQLAVPFQSFVSQLNQTLKATKNATDSAIALKQLHDAQAGVQSLMHDLTNRQMELMKENEAQAQSLLLGVLMTKQKEPMEKQLEVLKSAEFAKLPCVIAVLKAKDTKVPLFQQIAKFLDEHGDHKAVSSAKPIKKPDVSTIVKSLEVRVHKMEEQNKHSLQAHSEQDERFAKALANATAKHNTKLVHRLERLKKKVDRKFKMSRAVEERDVESMKDAVDAIKHGDMAKLTKAQNALQDSMNALRQHGNGFIVFIEEAHRLSNLDCPFCVAQCIEKCSSAGNTYTTCLTQCADAGSE